MANETVLITGASSGIGWELAKLFAADGSDLILVARNEKKLQDLADELGQQHGTAVVVLPADLTEPEVPQRVFDELAAAGKTVDVLVNNAGFGLRGDFVELDRQLQLDIVRVNILSLTDLTTLFLPGMVERNCGGVLNVASTASFQAGPRMAIYYASKAFVLSFTEAIREEVSGTKLRISCLCPGPTKTEFDQRAEMSDAPLFNMGAMSGESVAKIGYRGFRKGKTIVVAGFGNWLAATGSRLSPRWLSRKVARWLNK